MRVKLSAAALAPPALAFATLAGCASSEAGGKRPLLLQGVPYLAQSVITDTTGAEDAMRLTMEVPQSFDSVLTFYRVKLPLNGWRVRRESGDSSRFVILAQNDSVSLWLTLRHLEPRRTEYTMIGGLTRGARPR
jgi:hypothetical protein